MFHRSSLLFAFGFSRFASHAAITALAVLLASCNTVGFGVTGVSPAAGSTGSSPEVEIAITFDSRVDPDVLPPEPMTVVDANGAKVAGTMELRVEGRIMAFVPSSPLASATTFTVTVHEDLTSDFGSSLGKPYTWSFSTRDGFAAVAQSPLPGAKSVERDAAIDVTFDVPIDPQSVSAAVFTVTDTMGERELLNGQVEVLGDQQTIRFTPEGPYDILSNLEVEVLQALRAPQANI